MPLILLIGSIFTSPLLPTPNVPNLFICSMPVRSVILLLLTYSFLKEETLYKGFISLILLPDKLIVLTFLS